MSEAAHRFGAASRVHSDLNVEIMGENEPRGQNV